MAPAISRMRSLPSGLLMTLIAHSPPKAKKLPDSPALTPAAGQVKRFRNTRNNPVEDIESHLPLRVERYELRDDFRNFRLDRIAELEDKVSRGEVIDVASLTGDAATALLAVVTALAVHHQVSPPTINIFNQDPECDLDYCANTAREMKIDVAVKNNFGFGGTNGTLVFRRI